MALMEITKRIEAPVEDVFEAFTDFAGAAEHVQGIKRVEMLTDGPPRVGTRWRETRIMYGREATETLEITAFEPNRRYTAGCNACGCRLESTFLFQPEGDATRVRVTMDGQPLTTFAKLMAPLTRWMMGPSMKKCMDKDIEDLKKVVEKRALAAR